MGRSVEDGDMKKRVVTTGWVAKDGGEVDIVAFSSVARSPGSIASAMH
jgi:hypothetical protein